MPVPHAMRVCMLRFFWGDVLSLCVNCDNRMVGQLERCVVGDGKSRPQARWMGRQVVVSQDRDGERAGVWLSVGLWTGETIVK